MGCFHINVSESNSHKIGHKVQLIFLITQHSRDYLLMNSIIQYLDCGNVYLNSKRNTIEFKVHKLRCILKKIIPFFDKYTIDGVKLLDYADFCRVASLMSDKTHLTSEGLEQIRLIKTNMNKGRK